MSLGNLRDNGNKGTNYPYQLKTLQLLSEISVNTGTGGGGGPTYGSRTAVYQATNNGTGYSTSDIIIRYDLIDIATSTVVSTVWFNQTTQATIAAPAPGDLTPVSPPSSVTVINGVAGSAVNIQDGGNSITVDGIVTTENQSVFSNLVRDAALDLWIEVRIWDSSINDWVGTPNYYAVGDNTPASGMFPTMPISYIDYQADITSLGLTVTSILTSLSSTRTPKLISTSTTGTITDTVVNITIQNVGASAGTVTVSGGSAVSIGAGKSLTFDAGGNGNKLGASSISYNATGTTFVINYVY